jgi:hypothetical protein
LNQFRHSGSKSDLGLRHEIERTSSARTESQPAKCISTDHRYELVVVVDISEWKACKKGSGFAHSRYPSPLPQGLWSRGQFKGPECGTLEKGHSLVFTQFNPFPVLVQESLWTLEWAGFLTDTEIRRRVQQHDAMCCSRALVVANSDCRI